MGRWIYWAQISKGYGDCAFISRRASPMQSEQEREREYFQNFQKEMGKRKRQEATVDTSPVLIKRASK